MFQKILNFISSKANYSNIDILSLQLLAPLISNSNLGYQAWTASAIKPSAVTLIANEIIIHNRNSIIEFGSGISSLIFASLLKSSKKKGKLLTIEHDHLWSSLIKTKIFEYDLQDYVEIIVVPLNKEDLTSKSLWYSHEVLNKFLIDKSFDLVIVDGPPAYDRKKKLARYPALDFVTPFLKDDFTIFLDDANRDGERQIVKMWKQEFNFQHTQYFPHHKIFMGRSQRGFNINL